MAKQAQKKRKDKISSPSWTNNPELIVFAGEKTLPVGGIEQHSFGEGIGSLFGRTKVEVKADWEKVVNQIRYLLDEVSAVTKDYELKEITFQLGFSAEGKIVFVAKAGITTTISAKFTHKWNHTDVLNLRLGDVRVALQLDVDLGETNLPASEESK